MKALYETSFSSKKSTLEPLAFDVPWTRTDLLFANSWPPELLGAPVTPANAAMLSALGASGGGILQTGYTGSLTQPNGAGGDPIVQALQAQAKQYVSNGTRIPIPSNFSGQVVSASTNRNFLLLQNNSQPATSADVAPNLIVNLDGPVGSDSTLYLNLAPGQGIIFDQRVMNNAIYVAWGTGTGSFTQGGVCLTGYASATDMPTTAPSSGFAGRTAGGPIFFQSG